MLNRHRPSNRLATLCLLVLALSAQGCTGGDSGDYLSADLRQRVEALKLEAPESTDDVAVLSDRLDTLWQWANAYSLTGGPIPDAFPQLVANANRSLRDVGGGATIPMSRIPEFIRLYTREFQIKDEHPGAVGSLTLDPPGPFRAGDQVTVRLVYTVGTLGMAEGGGLLVRGARSGIQAEDPAGRNYVSVESSNPDASLTSSEPWGNWLGMHFLNRGGRARPGVPRAVLQFRLSGAALEEGDTITITYGDTSGGGPGFALQETSNDQVILHVYADIEGAGDLLRPAWPSFEVLGRDEVRYVNAVAPSIVAPGEPFTLAVRAEDRMKNPSSATMPALEVLLDGEPFRTIEAGSPAISLLENVSLAEPGIYRFSVRNEDGSIRATSNPVRVEEDPATRVYWGETHGHTAFAEGQGSPDGYYRFGRDVARLDFLSLSEHDIWMDDSEWRKLQELVEEYRIEGRVPFLRSLTRARTGSRAPRDAPPAFTPILSFEWTSRSPLGGHHNVFFRDTPGRSRVPNQKAPLLDELYAGLRSGNSTDDVLVIPHAHQPGDWTNSDPDLERLVEIQSGHGTFDWFGNKYLQNGFEVGFIGASDNHNGHPGYSGAGNRQLGGLAAVYAPENNADAIFSALRDRATYATTGERIILEATLNGGRMGTRLEDAAVRRIDCRVHGTAPIDAIDVIRNGTIVYTRRYLESALSEEARVQITFESSTEIHGERTPPRGGRPWKGAIHVAGAELVDYENPWFTQPATYRVARNTAERNRIDFDFPTRGRPKSLVLELRGASPDTVVTVEMETTTESRGSGGYVRVPQELPANTVRFQLGDLKGQVDRREVQVLEHTDALSAQIVTEGRALDQEFSFTDQGEVQAGDYYYLRVRQIDGSMAWSSPFWVGEGSG